MSRPSRCWCSTAPPRVLGCSPPPSPTTRSAIITPAFGEPPRFRPTGTTRPPATHAAVRPRTRSRRRRLLFVTNPCNPTGTLHTQPAITSLVRPGRTLLVDEKLHRLRRAPAAVRRRAARHRGPQEPDEDVLHRRAARGLPDRRFGARRAPRRAPQAWPVNGLALAAMTAWARQPPDDALIDRIAQQRTRLATAVTRACTYPAPRTSSCQGPARHRRTAAHAGHRGTPDRGSRARRRAHPDRGARGRRAADRGPVRTALAFLTRLPVPYPPNPDLSRAAWSFPLVGLIVGGAAAATRAGADRSSRRSPRPSSRSRSPSCITGALHEDGLADIADAVGAHVDRPASNPRGPRSARSAPPR